MVIVPTRDVPEELDGTVKVIVPLPLPKPLPATVIQSVLLAVEKSQFSGAVTSKEKVPPPEEMLWGLPESV